MITNSKTKPIESNTLFEFILFFSLPLIYFYGLTILTRKNILFEILICIVVPAIIFQINKKNNKQVPTRVIQLIFIELLFMLFVILSKVSINFNLVSFNYLLSYGFLILFILQFLFFIIYQYKVKSYFGMLRTIMFLIMVLPWFYHSNKLNVTDAQGRFLLWGLEAPKHIILYYCCWVIGIPLIDSVTLPNFKNALFHFASVTIAVWSQEFFHVRLLTASHLFILDSMLGFSRKNNDFFCILTIKQFQFYKNNIKDKIDYLTLLICFIIFVFNIYVFN